MRVPELNEETIRKVDRLIIHTHKHAPENYVAGFGDEGIEAHDAIDIIRKWPGQAASLLVEHPFWFAAPELRELITRKVAGQASPAETTYFRNKIGYGLQFASVDARVYW